MELKHLLFEQEGPIAYVYLNRPDQMNMLSLEVWNEMVWLQETINFSEEIRVVVIAGKGKLFSAGLDVSEMKKLSPAWAIRNMNRVQEVHNAWTKLPQPVICAIHGLCIGGAVEMAISCDMRIAASNASFTLPEVNFGFSPDMGATQRLTRLIGPGKAKRLIMTGDFINAEEAEKIGLVDMVVPEEELMDTVRKLAEKLAKKPPLTLAVAKRAVNIAWETSLNVGLQFEQMGSAFLFGTEDFQEGPRAFFEKRKPEFKGR